MLHEYAALFLTTLSTAITAQDGLCSEMREFEATTNAQLPRQVDQLTELIQVRGNCDGKSLTYVKRLLTNPELLFAGWKTRKQRQHIQLHCNAQGLAFKSGWTAIDILYGPDYAYITTFTTKPSDCPK